MMRLLLSFYFVSTTLAFGAQSTTVLVVPFEGIPQRYHDQAMTVAGDLYCMDWTPSLGINSADNIGFYGSAPAASTYMSIAIYRADGLVKYAEITINNVASVQANTTAVSSFTLTAGTEYRLCWCGDKTATNPHYITATEEGAEIQDFLEAVGTNFGYISSACSSTPPATAPTASLTSSGSAFPPPVLILSTNS